MDEIANERHDVQSNHHSMVGETSDPPNGPAVAGSVFAAVIVYAVRLPLFHYRIWFHSEFHHVPEIPFSNLEVRL